MEVISGYGAPGKRAISTATLLLTKRHGVLTLRILSALGCILTVVFVCTVSLYSQDMFPARRFTSDSTRDGFPSWSPDGKTIIHSFYNRVDGKEVYGSRKIPSGGGIAETFTEYPTEHPQWSPDGQYIVFDADTGSAIKMVEAKGGDPITFLPDSIRIHNGGLPCWSPAGSHIVFKDGTTGSLFVHDTRAGSTTRIFQQEGMVVLPGCWAPDGKSILFALMNRETRLSTMWRISPNGRERKQITGHHEKFYRYLSLSPDGTLLIYGAMEGRRMGLWIMPAEGGKSLPLAVTPDDHNEGPAWSPDGTRIAFSSSRSGRGDIYVMDVDVDKMKRDLRLLNQ